MNLGTAFSKNGILIRLTDERWKHIVRMHPTLIDKQVNVLNAVKDPEYILEGSKKELLAVSKLTKRSYIVVIYKEGITDGFVITAYETTDTLWLFKKEIIWNRHL